MRASGRFSSALLLLPIGHFGLAVDVWCGKAYRPGDPAVDPGGRITPPSRSPAPLLDLQIRPRVQPYLKTDVSGTLIVDAPPYGSVAVGNQKNGSLSFSSLTAQSTDLSFNVSISDTSLRPISDATVKVNSTGTLFGFDLNKLEARAEPYEFIITATGPDSHVYVASTQILRLPNRNDGGGVTKIDSLYGGMLVKAATGTDDGTWTSFFLYSYYLNGQWLSESPNNMGILKNYGYNVLHIVPGDGLGYDFVQLDAWLDQAQKLGLWIMYDMRHQFQNATGVEWQVNRLKARPNMLLWYTADEPDGHGDALSATKRAYDQIKSLDPYHPVSLCLNCDNYHYQEYSAGADIILSDVYPIGTNTSWSTEYGTVCNSTYGCCGCDNCQGYNDLTNVPARLDSYRGYQTQLGLPPKVFWGTPQAFGNAQFWKQTPTADEEVAMTMLSINHGAKGIIMWAFPTTPDLTAVTSRLAKVLTGGTCATYLLGAELIGGLRIRGGRGANSVDASMWRDGNSLLLSIVNPAHQCATGRVDVTLPGGTVATSITSVLWGDGKWRLIRVGGTSTMRVQRIGPGDLCGLEALSTDILLLALTPQQVVSGQDVIAVA